MRADGASVARFDQAKAEATEALSNCDSAWFLIAGIPGTGNYHYNSFVMSGAPPDERGFIEKFVELLEAQEIPPR